jgi:hypothetical protein
MVVGCVEGCRKQMTALHDVGSVLVVLCMAKGMSLLKIPKKVCCWNTALKPKDCLSDLCYVHEFNQYGGSFVKFNHLCRDTRNISKAFCNYCSSVGSVAMQND